MPIRTKPKPKPVTNADLANQIAGLGTEMGKRLDKLEETVKTAGLNGHSELLKAFLDREARRIDSRTAYAKVGSDIRSRFRFLAQPRAILKALFYAVLGGLGWKIASALPPLPPIHIPFG